MKLDPTPSAPTSTSCAPFPNASSSSSSNSTTQTVPTLTHMFPAPSQPAPLLQFPLDIPALTGSGAENTYKLDVVLLSLLGADDGDFCKPASERVVATPFPLPRERLFRRCASSESIDLDHLIEMEEESEEENARERKGNEVGFDIVMDDVADDDEDEEREGDRVSWKPMEKPLRSGSSMTSSLRRTVVFDLDGTLVLTLPTPSSMDHLRMTIRPYLRDLLSFALKHFEVVVWTAGSRVYAVRALEYIAELYNLPRIPHIITRDDGHWFTYANTVKDLRLLGRSMDDVFIVDDTESVTLMNRDNAIILPSFKGCATDNVLLSLTRLLKDMIDETSSGTLTDERSIPDLLEELVYPPLRTPLPYIAAISEAVAIAPSTSASTNLPSFTSLAPTPADAQPTSMCGGLKKSVPITITPQRATTSVANGTKPIVRRVPNLKLANVAKPDGAPAEMAQAAAPSIASAPAPACFTTMMSEDSHSCELLRCDDDGDEGSGVFSTLATSELLKRLKSVESRESSVLFQPMDISA